MKQLLTILMAISLYSIQAQTWTQVGSDIDGVAAGDELGYRWSTSMPDNNTVSVGARFNDDAGVDAGFVKIYTWNGTSWLKRGGTILGAAGDFCGSNAMADANNFVVGYPENSFNGNRTGKVRVYEWGGSQWQQKGSDIYGSVSLERFGWNLAMPDVNTIGVNTGSADPSVTTGTLRVYTWDGSSWQQKGSDIVGAAGEYLGQTITMPDANTLGISAEGLNAVRVYDWNGTAWVQRGSDMNGPAGTPYGFGYSLDMPDANTIVAGNPNDNFPSGIVKVFTWDGSSWLQKGADLTGDWAGVDVSMPDANTLAVAYTSYTRIYTWDGSSWNQVGSDMTLGQAASISMPSANFIAQGIPTSSPNGLNSGKVVVHQLSGATAIDQLSNAIDLKLYPNPNTGVFVLCSAAVEDEAMIELYDMKGARLMQLSTTTKETIVDTGNTPAGLYVVRLIVDGKSAEQVVLLR